MNEMQWTQLSAELKAAETSPKLLDELCERIKQLTAATQESEVPHLKNPQLQRPNLPVTRSRKPHNSKCYSFSLYCCISNKFHY